MHDGQTCHKLSQILEEVKYIPSLSARGARNVWPSHLPLDVCNQDGVFYLFFFFPFIFLLNMTPGANSKKNADDITSNDRGEDEGIFCFFTMLDLDA